MKFIKSTILSVVLAGATSLASAASVGTLSYDGSIITDSATGTYYLGWDQAAGLTYAETLAATQVGGIYEEYHIASQTEAYAFYHAGGGGYYDTPGAQIIKTIGAYSAGIFGENYLAFLDRSVAWFLSDEGVDIGILSVLEKSQYVDESHFYINDAIGSFSTADRYTDLGDESRITWLLVSDTQNLSPVPVPAAAWLFGSALLGFAGWSRHKKQVV